MFEERLCKVAVPRVLPTMVEEPANKLPKQAQKARLWALRKLLTAEPTIPSFVGAESWREEFIALRPQATEDHQLHDLPLIVLTRRLKTDDRHKEVAAGFAALSRAGKLMIAEHSEHEIHMYQPDLVIQSLRDIVEEAGTEENGEARMSAPARRYGCLSMPSKVPPSIQRCPERLDVP